jgi:hypothetical protein
VVALVDTRHENRKAGQSGFEEIRKRLTGETTAVRRQACIVDTVVFKACFVC